MADKPIFFQRGFSLNGTWFDAGAPAPSLTPAQLQTLVDRGVLGEAKPKTTKKDK